MTIATSCPGCRTTVEVPDELLGRRVRCPIPQCGLTFTAEAGAAGAPPAPAEPLSPLAQYEVPPLPRRGAGPNPLWIILALVSLTVIAASGVAIWTMLGAAPKTGSSGSLPTPAPSVPSIPKVDPED